MSISFEYLTREHVLEDAIEMLIKVVNAVGYAHQCGVVHRDIKAQNIMIGSFGEVWLVDWGLAVSVIGMPMACTSHMQPSLIPEQGL